MKAWEHPHFRKTIIEGIQLGLTTAEMVKKCRKELFGADEVSETVLMARLNMKSFWRELLTIYKPFEVNSFYRLTCLKSAAGREKFKRYPTVEKWLEEPEPAAALGGTLRRQFR
jgi:hypothetical protein